MRLFSSSFHCAVVVLLAMAAVSTEGQIVVDTRIVLLDTPDFEHELESLPDGLSRVEPGSSFWVQVWLKHLGPVDPDLDPGITWARLDVAYTTAVADVTSVQVDSNFGIFSDFTIDDEAGLVDEFGGGNLGNRDLGYRIWAKLATFQVTATDTGVLTFEMQASDEAISLFAAPGQAVPWEQVNMHLLSVCIGDDADGDGVADCTDCDDQDGQAYPGAVEVCDGKDNNCDGQVDEGVGATWYRDADGDGYGDPNDAAQACEQPAGYVQTAGDCNDLDAEINPDATEICDDGDDNDCDGLTDCSDDDCDCACGDDDGDGVCNAEDLCDGDDDTLDSDGDGTADCLDQCPDDPDKIAPGNCGCGMEETPGCGQEEPADQSEDGDAADVEADDNDPAQEDPASSSEGSTDEVSDLDETGTDTSGDLNGSDSNSYEDNEGDSNAESVDPLGGDDLLSDVGCPLAAVVLLAGLAAGFGVLVGSDDGT